MTKLSYGTHECLLHINTQGYFDGEGACGVMVSIVGNGHGETSSNPGTRLIAFHIALISLGKGMNPIILPPTISK